jgi:hypothetical protein
MASRCWAAVVFSFKIRDLKIGVFPKAQQDLMKTRRSLDSICHIDGFRSGCGHENKVELSCLVSHRADHGFQYVYTTVYT